ncbi:MAG TPA: trypsin-like serine protease [Chitinophagaceae bacterium]
MATHQFIGDHGAPTPLSSVRTRRSTLGTGKIPAELSRMFHTRTLYTDTGSNKKPAVEIESLEKEGQRLWKVSVPVGEKMTGARPGLSLERHPSAKFLKEIKKDVSFNAFKPAWIDASPVPRIKFEKAARALRRLDGTRTEPLWVYDNARYAFEDDSWPWGLVGRIFNSDGFSGTGTLVGDRLVITAGHMVPWNSVAKGSWWIRFVPAYFNGTSLYGAGVESYVSDARGYNTSGNVTGYDWAILRLYEPLGSSLGYMGYNSYSDNWNNLPVWSNIGYPGDIDNAEEPAFQQGFTINDTDGDSDGGEELETENCDLNHGNSGGPAFAWWNNGTDPRIVGVVSGQETEYKFPFSTRNDNVFASGNGFVNLCAWGRSNWPA